jgi:hypothetical protein
MRGPRLSPCLAVTLGQTAYHHRNRPAYAVEFASPFAQAANARANSEDR